MLTDRFRFCLRHTTYKYNIHFYFTCFSYRVSPSPLNHHMRKWNLICISACYYTRVSHTNYSLYVKFVVPFVMNFLSYLFVFYLNVIYKIIFHLSFVPFSMFLFTLFINLYRSTISNLGGIDTWYDCYIVDGQRFLFKNIIRWGNSIPVDPPYLNLNSLLFNNSPSLWTFCWDINCSMNYPFFGFTEAGFLSWFRLFKKKKSADKF